MGEYTPSTDEVRGYILAADRVTAHMFSADAPDALEAFDRWLVAHDAEVREKQADHDAIRINDLDTRLVAAERQLAEVRASVVSEEPEWEIGFQLLDPDGNSVGTGAPFPTLEEAAEWGVQRAREETDRDPTWPTTSRVVRRRKAGAWLPVEQKGTEQ